MIDINLVPADKGRRQKKTGFFHAGFMLPREVIIGLIGGFLVLLALGHVVLQVTIVGRYIQLKHQQDQWQKVMPAKQEVDRVMKDLQIRQVRYKAVRGITGSMDMPWAAKLSALSLHLPKEIWLSDIILESGNLTITGSSVSKHNLEKISVYNYVKRLKQDGLFMEGVVSVEVESVKSRLIGGTPVADFVIRVMLSQNESEAGNARHGRS